MQNNRIRVLDLARELGVHVGDVQYGLRVMKLPERRQAVSYISGQHAELLRAGYRGGKWRRRSAARDAPIPQRSRPATQTHFPRCTCCELRYPIVLQADVPAPGVGVCPTCMRHPAMPSESPADRADRLQDHLDRTRRWAASMASELNEHEAKLDEAYRTRNAWRRALVKVLVEHAPDEESDGGRCACGEPFPCVTRRQLQDINRGIYRQVGEFEAMPPPKRERLLDGERWTAADEIEYQWDRRLAGDDEDEAEDAGGLQADVLGRGSG